MLPLLGAYAGPAQRAPEARPGTTRGPPGATRTTHQNVNIQHICVAETATSEKKTKSLKSNCVQEH